MLKVIALIKRRADLSRAEFRRHYEEIHVPLALRHIDQFRKYVRNHMTAEVVGGPAGFDCLTELWYADQTALQHVLAYLQSAAAEPIRRDELSFMAKQENVFFSVEEHLVLERGSVPSAPVSKVVVLAARPQEEPVESFRRRYGATLSAWLDGLPQPLRCVQNTVLPTAAAAPPWDVITMLWSRTESVGLLHGALRGLGRSLVVSVCECETPLALLRKP
jgi:uncharacterized protein (TIGR02118 family)